MDAQSLHSSPHELGQGRKSFWCDAGGLENLLHHTGNTPAGRSSCDLNDMDGHPQINTVEADYLDYCCSVLQHL